MRVNEGEGGGVVLFFPLLLRSGLLQPLHAIPLLLSGLRAIFITPT